MTRTSVVRRAALALAALPLLACGSPMAATESDRLAVESVEVHVRESFPVQVSAEVKGYLRDGCETLGATTQTRSGNTITITIETGRDTARSCIQVISPVLQQVPLQGPFESGTYLVRVNAIERTFRVD